MIFYRTKLPVVEDFGLKEFTDIVLRWNQGSKFDKFNNISTDISLPFSVIEDNKKLEIDTYDEKLIVASKFTKEDERGIWTTEFVLNMLAQTISVVLSRVTSEFTTDFVANYYPPYFMKMLVNERKFGSDVNFDVLNTSIAITSDNYMYAADVFKKSKKYMLPIVYISKNSNGTYATEPNDLAFRLQAMAHVLHEDDENVSALINEILGKKAIKAGRVYLIFPNLNAKEKVFNLRGDCDVSHLSDRIATSVYAYMNSEVVQTLDSWTGVQNDKLITNNNSLLFAHENVKNENIELYDIFDQQLKKNDECISNLNNEVQKLQMEVQGLRMKLASTEGVPIITFGEESDLYDGEIREIILDILSEYQKNIKSNSRRAHIINDILENNVYRAIPERKKEDLKKLLKGYSTLTGSLRSGLEELGFSISGDGKHYKLIYHDDNRYAATMSKTSSDGRAGNNLAAVIAKDMF